MGSHSVFRTSNFAAICLDLSVLLFHSNHVTIRWDSLGQAKIGAIGSGCHSNKSPEYLRKLLGFGKTGSTGDDGHGKIGVGKQLLGQIDPNAADFFKRASAKDFAEFAFERSALDGQRQEQLADADPFAGMGENEPQGVGDIGIADGDVVSRFARDDAGDRDEPMFFQGLFVIDHGREDVSGIKTDALGGQRDATERWAGQAADDGVVATSQNGDRAGDPDGRRPAGVDDGSAEGIVHREYPGRLGKGIDPLAEFFETVGVEFCGSLVVADLGDSIYRQAIGETNAARFGIDSTGQSDESKMTHLSFKEMAGGQAADDFLIAGHVG